ncbi:TetR/AcrR family transcriptional regulator [Actinopolymorpha alba]|uniref:TetR/AcrR family transcriptional regulator n=1 Tax=Actinopolymorpha alba TaxID=533267 RepID=UPI0003826197|nr:TetR/AcrR family transcriptional regulator [Actinopolymorpha alba]
MANTKQRIVEASIELFRRQGYTGTGVKQIVAAANAPFGSLYHFFPGGKQELGEEVIRSSGAMYLHLISAIFDPAPDVVTAVRNVFDGAAETLVETNYADACPIATVALEVASTSEPLRQATADVFDSWLRSMASRFEAAGMTADTARSLAISTLALLEGAFILSRAQRSAEPLKATGETASAAVRAALPG